MGTPKENISLGFGWVVGKLNALFALIPTKTSDLTNDGQDTNAPFVQQDGIKTVNGNSLIGSGNLVINGQSVIPDYTDIADMLANQVSQSDKGSYLVLDATADPNITFASGETKVQAEYRFNGTTTGSIDDYTLISAPYGNHTGGTSIEPQVTDDIHKIDPNIPAQIQPLSPLTTPTYDGSGQTTHPSVVYIKEGFNGYKYWMAHTPYAGSDPELENPSIIASNDGIIWETPAGITNPIVPSPAGADFNNDPCLIMGLDGKLWMYHGGSIALYALSSVDGINWSSPTNIGSGGVLSPINISLSVIIEGDGYATYGVDSSTKTMHRVLHTLPSSGYGTVEAVTINNMPEGKQIWHMEVRKYYEEYHLFACLSQIPTNSGYTDLYFGTSQDGLTFTFSNYPLSARMTGTWTESRVYKSSAILLNDNTYALWLAGEDSNTWRVGYSIVSLDGSVKTTNARLSLDKNRNPNVIYKSENKLYVGNIDVSTGVGEEVVFSLKNEFLCTHAILKLRRSSDNAVKFVFFDYAYITLNSFVGDTDTTPSATTLGTWIGSDDAYVEQWIAQYPAKTISQKAQQGTTSRQPKFIDAGAIILKNGKPAIDFLSDNRYLDVTGGVSLLKANNNFTLSVVYAFASASDFNTSQIISTDASALSGIHHRRKQDVLGFWLTRDDSSLTFFSVNLMDAVATTDQVVATLVQNNLQIVGYLNNKMQKYATRTGVYVNNVLRIGSNLSSGTEKFNGTIQEIRISNKGDVSNIDVWQNKIKTYYSIP